MKLIHFALFSVAILSSTTIAKADVWSRTVAPVGHAIENTAHKAGHAAENAGHGIGHAVKKGAHDAGHTAEKAAHDTGKTIEKAVQDIGYNLRAHPSDAKPNYPPFYVPLQRECPTYKGSNNTWVNYLSKPTPGRNYVTAGVEFKYARNLQGRDGLGNIDPSACYTVTYSPKSGYGSYRTFSYSRMYEPIYNDMHKRDSGLPGDPNKYQINVDGLLLRYNKAGEIYDKRGRVAGVLVCYLSNRCEGYRY